MNALKAFDAAARRNGFTAAALELSISPGGVSRHVANLEKFLGEPLFERHHNEIELTPAGAQYFARIRPALDVVEDASRWIEKNANPRQVGVIAAGPGLARDWLLPRLADFIRQYPSVELAVSSNMALIEETDFEVEDIDVVIHRNLNDISSTYCDFLFETDMQVVCSPKLAQLSCERDLHGQTLLYHSYGLTAWRQWFDVAGIEPPAHIRTLTFGDGSLTIQAAIEGLGFALGESVCFENYIRGGQLVSPFPHRLRTGNKFFMTVNARRAQRPSVRLFREWVLKQARKNSPGPANPSI